MGKFLRSRWLLLKARSSLHSLLYFVVILMGVTGLVVLTVATETDSDHDGIDDTQEIFFNLDPFDPSDATQDCAKLVPVLIKAIQEQQEQIDELKQEIEALKGR